MKQIIPASDSGTGRPRPGVRPAAFRMGPIPWVASFLWLGLGATVVGAQGLQLPIPDLSVEALSGEVRITWPSVEDGAGRAITGIETDSLADSIGVDGGLNTIFADTSDFSITGDFELDCDFFLEIIKISTPADTGRSLLILYQTFRNLNGFGGAVGSGILEVREPDTTYFFDPDVAGNLGIRFSSNVTQPTSPLGTIGLSVGGMNSTNSISRHYFVQALNTVSSLSEGLQVQVVGPVDSDTLPEPFPPGTLVVPLTINAPGTYPIQDGMSITVTDGAVATDVRSGWEAHYAFSLRGKVTAALEAFEGYHVWRADLPNTNEFTLLGEIQATCDSERYELVLLQGAELIESNISFLYFQEDQTFELVDKDIHDDFPYRYALSTFDRGFLGNDEDVTFEGELNTSIKLYPAQAVRNADLKAFVVPNPYDERSAFQEGDRRVVFTNLPDACTIRIFTAATDHVATLDHGPGEAGSISATSRTWDLRTSVGRTVAAGIYIYSIEGTGATSFQQSGKLIVVR